MMLEPNYTCNHSLLTFKFQVRGNVELAATLERVVQQACNEGLGLYTTQETVRDAIISGYDLPFYEKNAEAINFIVENEYCNAERMKRPFFDYRAFEEDRKRCIMY